MNIPKRHHWWPQLNSGHWCNADGKINVLNRDGSTFLGKPQGLGVVGHLYSKELEDGSKDTAIETWFAHEVDGPFSETLNKLTDEKLVSRQPFQGNPQKAQVAKQLGYRITKEVEYISIFLDDRERISKYVAALLVRNPNYLKKLEDFHKLSEIPKNNALYNMRQIYDIYFEKIMMADFIIIKRDSDNEFVFSDGGIVAREPWSQNGGIPFDIHYPMTPDLALQILPALHQAFPRTIPIFRAANQGVSSHNRITLQYADRQVFGRGAIPSKFVMKNWGRAAPQHIGYRHVNGELETKVDWSRYFH